MQAESPPKAKGRGKKEKESEKEADGPLALLQRTIELLIERSGSTDGRQLAREEPKKIGKA